MTRKIFLLFPIFFFIACTQLIDEENSYTKAYTGDDGCLVCHTNEARLQALAPSEDGGGPPDGG
jgi:hypothetical protein